MQYDWLEGNRLYRKCLLLSGFGGISGHGCVAVNKVGITSMVAGEYISSEGSRRSDVPVPDRNAR